VRERRGRQAGFSYIEVLVGIMVLALVAVGLAQGLAQSSALIGKSKADSIAHSIAVGELDQAHRIDYGDLGTVGGNPPGTIPATQTKTQSNQRFTVATRVDYVDDQALGQPKNFVNYKKVSVTVTPVTGTTAPVTQTTLIAPPSIGAVANKATIIATVVDAKTGLKLQGVSVTADLSTSPVRTSVTDANGQVVFAGLDPSAIPATDPRHKYRLQAAAPGYVTHTSTGQDVMRQHLAAKQTWNATLKMFKPTTIQVNLTDRTTGRAITEAATTTIDTDAPVQSESKFATNGAFTFTTIAGMPIEPGQYTVRVQPDCYRPVTLPPAEMPAGYPTTTTHTVNVPLDPLPHGYLNVRVVDDGGRVIPAAQVQVSGGSADLAPTIRAVDVNGWVHYCLQPSAPIRYIVSASAVGYGTSSLLATVVGNITTSIEVRLTRVRNACGIRLELFLNGALQPNRLARLVGTGGIVYDQFLRTSGLAGTTLGTAFFPSLVPGTYLAYYENGFTGGAVTWSPSAGKAVACIAGQPDRRYRLP